MELKQGILHVPQRLLVYGPEGIGKSTLGSQMPFAVFIDVEGSTEDLDVLRTPTPSSWRALLDMTEEFVGNQQGRKTLVIDTADWAERLCISHVLSSNNMTALGGQEDFGRSYNLLEQEWCRWLDVLSRVAQKMHVCLLAHAKMRKFEVPDQVGAYDRWELKMERKTSAATKEWARTVLFLNYKTYVVKGKKGEATKATGGHRVMYATHNPVWDAKNRAGLPDEMRLEFGEIEKLFRAPERPAPQAPTPAPQAPTPAPPAPQAPKAVPGFLLPLFELMNRDNVAVEELQLAVAKRGYYPNGTPLENYDPQFVAGKLVAFWPQVLGMIDQVRKEVAGI